MPELPDLTGLPSDFGDHLTPPPYDALVRRGEQRRRRRGAAAVTASVAVVALTVSAVGVLGEPAAAPTPSTSSPTPAPSPLTPPTTATDETRITGTVESARAIIADARAHLILGVADDGSQLGVWARGEQPQTPTALAVRAADGEVTIAPGPHGVRRVVAVPGGWLATTVDARSRDQTVLIKPDGSVVPVADAGATSSPRPGDIALRLRRGLVLYRPATGTLFDVPPLGRSYLKDGHVTADGVLVATVDRPDAMTWARLDDDGWIEGELVTGVGVSGSEVAGAGGHLTISGTTDSAPELDGGPDPISTIGRSDDSGATWTTVDVTPELTFATTLTTTSTGTVLVGAGEGLYRLSVDGDESLRPDLLGSVQSVGDRVFLAHDASVRVSDDDGLTWSDVPPPGREPATADAAAPACGDPPPTPEADEVLVSFGCPSNSGARLVLTATVDRGAGLQERLETALTAYFAGPPTPNVNVSPFALERLLSVEVTGDRAVVDIDLSDGAASTSNRAGEAWAALTAMSFQFPEVEVMEPRANGSCRDFALQVQAGDRCVVATRSGDYVEE